MAAPTFVAATTSGVVSGNTQSCFVPTHAENDILYMILVQNDVGEDSEPTSTGWDLVTNQDISNDTRLWVLRHVADDSEPSFYTFTWTEPNTLHTGGMVSIRGADTTTPEAATPSGATGDDDSPDPPASGTVASGDYLALAYFGIQGKRGPNSGPTNYIERIDHYSTGGGPAANHLGMGVSTRELTGITAENPGVFTTNQGDAWFAGMLLIQVAPPDATANLTAVNAVVSIPTVVATGDVSAALTAVNAVVSIDSVVATGSDVSVTLTAVNAVVSIDTVVATGSDAAAPFLVGVI